MDDLRTNRGLINEWLWCRWCLFKATIYAMVMWKKLYIHRTLDDKIYIIRTEGKWFYRYGDE